MSGLIFLRETSQPDPGFKKLCRKLLNDSDPAVQLEAAIPLAESAITTNPNEPKLAPLLLSGLESKATRDHWVNLNWYGFQKQPPGGSGPPAIPFGFPYHQDQGEMLRTRIKTGLIRLKPYLTAEQLMRFRELTDSWTNLPAQ
jgi:hypothetical protein